MLLHRFFVRTVLDVKQLLADHLQLGTRITKPARRTTQLAGNEQ